jgi:hypothetical protein
MNKQDLETVLRVLSILETWSGVTSDTPDDTVIIQGDLPDDTVTFGDLKDAYVVVEKLVKGV